MGRLQGLVTVITGAGSGIGRASALAFAREGACVVAADLRDADATAEQVRAAGGSAVAVQVDVTRAAEVGKMIDTGVSQFGKLDILFNNAGVPQSFTTFEDSTDE